MPCGDGRADVCGFAAVSGCAAEDESKLHVCASPHQQPWSSAGAHSYARRPAMQAAGPMQGHAMRPPCKPRAATLQFSSCSP